MPRAARIREVYVTAAITGLTMADPRLAPPTRPASPGRSPALLPGDAAPALRVTVDGREWTVPGLRTVAFLRPLDCPAGRASADRLRGLVDLAIVPPGPGAAPPGLPTFVDADGALRRAWHIGADRRFAATLRGAWRHPPLTTLRVLRHGGALFSCFVLDGSGVVQAAWHACHVADLPDVGAIRAALGR